MKPFFTFAQKNGTYLDVYVLLRAVNWTHRKETVLRPALLTKDGVHEQHFSSVHIWRELGVEDLGFLCLLVALDEDLADADGAAAVPETLLHGLTYGGTRGDAASIKELFGNQCARITFVRHLTFSALALLS